MPETNPYLMFDGNCREAMQAYERILGGKMQAMMTYAEAPPDSGMPPGSGDRVMHACLGYEGGLLMASDCMHGMQHEPMQGMFVTAMYPDAASARRTFQALADGGREIMPLAKTFWSDAYGMLVDRFGTPWMVMSETHGACNGRVIAMHAAQRATPPCGSHGRHRATLDPLPIAATGRSIGAYRYAVCYTSCSYETTSHEQPR